MTGTKINKIIYINARSVLKNFNEIQLLVDTQNPMILMCSEARITEIMATSEYSIDNFNSVQCLSHNRHTGGDIIYIKKQIKFKVIENKSVDRMFWYLIIEICDSDMRGVYTIFYRSPSRDV